MLNILVPQVVLYGSCVVAFIRKLVAAGMPQHVGMDWESDAGIDT